MCQDMSNGDKKKYWRQLKRLEGSKDDHEYIPDYTLINHFKEILYDDEIKLKYQNGSGENEELDHDITEEEILKAAKILKLGKGIGIDNLYNEMIRPLVDNYPNLVVRIFNDILIAQVSLNMNLMTTAIIHLPNGTAKNALINFVKTVLPVLHINLKLFVVFATTHFTFLVPKLPKTTKMTLNSQKTGYV